MKTNKESQNMSELANDILNLLKIDNYEYSNNLNRNICYDKINEKNFFDKKINYNNEIKVRQIKENNFILNPSISKVDEGINVRMSLSQLNNSNDNIIKGLENNKNKIDKNEQFKITKNERLSFINQNINNTQEKKNKILSTDYEIGNQLSIFFNTSVNIESKVNDNNKNKEKKILKNRNTNNKASNTKQNSINLNESHNKKIKYNKKEEKEKIIKNKNIVNNINLKPKIKINIKNDSKNLQKNKIKTETNMPNKNKLSKAIKKSNNFINQKPITKKEEFSKKLNLNKNSNKTNNLNKNKLKKRNINIKIEKSNNNVKNQSTTSSEEKNEKLINQIIKETESIQKKKKKGKLHIQFNLKKNRYINYNQNDLINICTYTNDSNEKIDNRNFDINIYNEILKSKMNLMPIIKKNYSIKNFKINKNYKLNENLEEKEIVPDLYTENKSGNFKSLEKVLERSIEKTFNKKYEKRKNENENYISYSDNKKEIKKGLTGDIKGKNLFNEIQQMFKEDSADEEHEENENDNSNNYENDDYIIKDFEKESFLIENEFNEEKISDGNDNDIVCVEEEEYNDSQE